MKTYTLQISKKGDPIGEVELEAKDEKHARKRFEEIYAKQIAEDGLEIYSITPSKDEIGRTHLSQYTTTELARELMTRSGVKAIEVEPYIEVESKSMCNGKKTNSTWAKYGGYIVLTIYGQ